jgi:6-phosphogluconate dehydrogenase
MTDIGIVGLGVMGRNLSLNIARNGFPVRAFEIQPELRSSFAATLSEPQISIAATLEELIASLDRPRKIVLLVKAGAPVDWYIEQFKPLLDKGDILIDCGNSHFRDTERRQQDLAKSEIQFVGCGISGGGQGALLGPSLMPGGEANAYREIQPIWEKIAAKTEDGPCVTYIGSNGSGHFVKMVHNGIEYGDMQLIAESYDVLRNILGLSAGEIADIFEEWQEGALQSYLLEISVRILRVIDPESQVPLVDLIVDSAGQKGTGRWASEIAMELGAPTPTINAAVLARNMSAQREARLLANREFTAPEMTSVDEGKSFITLLRDALLASRICTYAQGMNLIREASLRWKWDIKLAEVARIWRGGCIIRAQILKTIMQAYRHEPGLDSLLLHPQLRDQINQAQSGWRSAVSNAQLSGVPVPAMTASLAYFELTRSARLPLNLTQAQRDYFGAHTYQRLDKPELGAIHTEWEKS